MSLNCVLYLFLSFSKWILNYGDIQHGFILHELSPISGCYLLLVRVTMCSSNISRIYRKSLKCYRLKAFILMYWGNTTNNCSYFRSFSEIFILAFYICPLVCRMLIRSQLLPDLMLILNRANLNIFLCKTTVFHD